MHYRKQGRHYPHVVWRPFLVFSNGTRSCSRGNLGQIYVKNPLNLIKKAQMSTKVLILAHKVNVFLVPLNFPQCSVRGLHPVICAGAGIDQSKGREVGLHQSQTRIPISHSHLPPAHSTHVALTPQKTRHNYPLAAYYHS